MTHPDFDFNLAVASKIKALRQQKGIDQETIARVLDLTRTSIINIEKGRQKPSIQQVWTIARFLKVQITDIIPPVDHYDHMVEWQQKIESHTYNLCIQGEIASKEEQNLILEFISATRISL